MGFCSDVKVFLILQTVAGVGERLAANCDFNVVVDYLLRLAFSSIKIRCGNRV